MTKKSKPENKLGATVRLKRNQAKSSPGRSCTYGKTKPSQWSELRLGIWCTTFRRVCWWMKQNRNDIWRRRRALNIPPASRRKQSEETRKRLRTSFPNRISLETAGPLPLDPRNSARAAVDCDLSRL